MRNTVTAKRPQRGFGSRMRRVAIGAAAVVAAVGAVAVQAQGHHGAGMGGPGAMMFGGSPEHIGRGVDRMLDGLNATDAQRAQVKQIALAAATDLKAQHDAGRGLRDQGLQLFATPTVDARAAEALRRQMLDQHDQASKRVLQAMLDVSAVLTPEQRAKFAERMKQRHAGMAERMHGMRGEGSTR